MVVVFPAPFGPRKPVILPGSTVNDRLSTARVSPYLLVRLRASIIFQPSCLSASPASLAMRRPFPRRPAGRLPSDRGLNSGQARHRPAGVEGAVRVRSRYDAAASATVGESGQGGGGPPTWGVFRPGGGAEDAQPVDPRPLAGQLERGRSAGPPGLPAAAAERPRSGAVRAVRADRADRASRAGRASAAGFAIRTARPDRRL